MATTKDQLLEHVEKLIADNEAQTAAHAEKAAADANVIQSLSNQNTKGEAYAGAKALVTADIDTLLVLAKNLTDEDDAT